MYSIILNILLLNFVLDQRYKNSTSEQLAEEQMESKSQVCYELYIGKSCFSTQGVWNKSPFSAIERPNTPEKIGTKLYHFSDVNNFTILDPKNLSSMLFSSLNKSESIVILTHGYLSSKGATWIKEITGEFFRRKRENIIIVDWNKGAKPPYIQAVANLRVVAYQLAQLIYLLTQVLGFSRSSFHVIGHSLGSHLAGLCGAHLQKRYGILLPRITALDPAGPLFKGSHPSTRLDASDADFVDVIHTDNWQWLGFPLSTGIDSQIGDVDFYPNGASNQPQCEGNIACPHKRASKLFIESMRHSCTFLGVKCSSFEKFVQGQCWDCKNSSCAIMGMHAKKLQNSGPKGKYFLLTHGTSPFCGIQYRISIKISNTTAAWEQSGEFASVLLKLNGPKVSSDFIQFSSRSIFFEPGTVHRSVILSPEVGELTSVQIIFQRGNSLLNPISWRMRSPSIYLQSVSVESLLPEKRKKFCPGKSLIIPLDAEQTLKEGTC